MSKVDIRFLENYKQMRIKKLQRDEKHESNRIECNRKEREIEAREKEPFLKFFIAFVLLYSLFI